MPFHHQNLPKGRTLKTYLEHTQKTLNHLFTICKSKPTFAKIGVPQTYVPGGSVGIFGKISPMIKVASTRSVDIPLVVVEHVEKSPEDRTSPQNSVVFAGSFEDEVIFSRRW